MHTTPPSLLQRLREGPDNRAAWEQFVKLYTPLIYHWSRRGNLLDQDATDLVQEVFAVLVEKMPGFQYDPAQSFRSWLRTITVNKRRDFCRRRRIAPEVPVGEMSDVPDPADDDFAQEEYRRYLVTRALALMQTDFKATTWKACWEHVVSGRPAAEVAAELGITENAVYVAKSRVLRRLREELAGFWD